MNREIPEELITDILWRLPNNECVVRLRCACKSWNTLLSDPSFILRENPADSGLRIMVNFNNENDESVYSLHSGETLEPLLPSPLRVPFNAENPIIHHYRSIVVSGSCNGLICISDDDYDVIRDVILWNPATGETKLAPPSPSPPWYSPVGAVWFGFDSETNDYKIIRQLGHAVGSRGSSYLLEVYSLRNDSWTRLAEDDDNGYYPFLSSEPIQQWHKGKLYWWNNAAWNSNPNSLHFNSFDISSQEFQKVDFPYPPEIDACNNRKYLMNEDSMVAVFPTDHDFGTGGRPEIWVLFKYWASESWTKLLVMSNPFPDTIFFSFAGISRNLKWLFCGCAPYHSPDNVCSLIAIHPDEGKLGLLDLDIQTRRWPIVVNYMPSQVCMRDYYMSS